MTSSCAVEFSAVLARHPSLRLLRWLVTYTTLESTSTAVESVGKNLHILKIEDIEIQIQGDILRYFLSFLWQP
jgi:hypothetical protein